MNKGRVTQLTSREKIFETGSSRGDQPVRAKSRLPAGLRLLRVLNYRIRRMSRHWLRRDQLKRRVTLNLALQGGGAHGAFTWGVLDRLLEESRLSFDGVSGASAGALNGVVMADGWLEDGRDGAREALHRFWERVSESAQLSPLHPGPLDYLLGGWTTDWSPGFILMRALTRLASPYQLNPTGLNPLIGLVEGAVDFDRLRRSRRPRLFVAATNVHSGKLRVFRNDELTPRVLAASACLPFLFQAVEIEGEHYWDGGYTANPPLFPLVFECAANDVLLVQLTPSWREAVPTKVDEIVDRASEIGFNANLLRELQLLAILRRIERDDSVTGHAGMRVGRLNLHHIAPPSSMEQLGAASRVNTDWTFLTHLRDLGRDSAQAWLWQHHRDLDRRSSLDLASFL